MVRKFNCNLSPEWKRRTFLKSVGVSSVSATGIVGSTGTALGESDDKGHPKGEKRGAAYFPPKGKSKPTFSHPFKGEGSSNSYSHTRPPRPDDGRDDEGNAEAHPRQVDEDGEVHK